MTDYNSVIQNVNHKLKLSFEPCFESNSSYTASFVGLVSPHGYLKIAFKNSFPYELPDIFVQNISDSRLHVEIDGKICLTDQSSLLIDTQTPEELVINCLGMAAKTLSIAPGSSAYNQDLKKEFLSYWGNYGIHYLSIFQIPKGQRYIREVPLFKLKKTLLLANSIYDANRYLCDVAGFGAEGTVAKPSAQAIVIRLKQDSILPSPFKRHNWSSIIRYIINNTDSETYHEFLQKMKLPVKKHELIIILIFPNAHGDTLFGFKVKFTNQHNMPMIASKTRNVLQIDILREDYDFLLSRGGATPSLKDKTVLLLGCGSIGGFLAGDLCQMGVTQLDLLDSDIFLPGNIHRHYLGYDVLRRPVDHFKADLLRDTLIAKYPYIEIDSLNYKERSAEAVILARPERLAQYDLVISALGEPTINLAINELLIKHSIKTPFIVCFNEPYGIGGHVITTNLSDESCLRCYYSDIVEGTLSPFLGSLVAPDQNFKKSLSGCSGTFVPYSALDSQQTAINAARKAVDVLTGKLTKNDFYTWRGDSSLLESQGYVVSEFFSRQNPSNVVNPQCPICQRRGRDS